MTIKGTLTANLTDGIVALTYREGAAIVTEYRYEDGEVEMSILSAQVVVPLENLRSTVRDLTHFVAMIRSIAETDRNLVGESFYEEKTERDEHEHHFVFEVSGVKILDVAYDYDSKEATFKPRTAITLAFPLFAKWASRIETMLRYAQAGGFTV